MKYTRVIIIFLSVAVWLSLTACSAKSDPSSAKSSSQNDVNTADAKKTDTVQTDMQKTDVQETDASDECIEQYKAFLQGEISSETKDDGPLYLRDFCNTVIPEEDDEVIHCALYDMTGDGVPELHLLTDISYSVHTIENDQLITWYEGDRYCRPLNNGAILEKIESTGIQYGYYFLDSKGEMFLCVGFSEPPKGAKKNAYKYFFGTGGADAPYDYNDTVVSKKKWNKLAKPFLKMKSDKIIWKKIKEFLD